MKKLILPIAVIGFLSVGCAGMSADSEARIAEITAQTNELSKQLASVYFKAKDGTLTVAEAEKAMADTQAAILKNFNEIADIKAAENASWGAVAGGAAGVVGRSLLHGLAATGVGGGGWIGMILSLLLGGSATGKKKES